jgi:membrane fusion protein, multidrug efflux system
MQFDEKNGEGQASTATSKRPKTRLAIVIILGVAAVAIGSKLTGSLRAGSSAHAADPPSLPEVVVSKPLHRDVDTRIGVLGQFSAVEHVELRAQVGGTLTQILFRDGDTVRKGELLFTVDSRPYEIKLAQANALLQTAQAHVELSERQLERAKVLERSSAGSTDNVDQRTSDLKTAQASVQDAQAQIRDAQFDLEHCRIISPLTGRIGSHFVSVGNLIAGSRTALSPTTLLADLVSLDPIYLDFDMSEAEFLNFSKYHKQRNGKLSEKIQFSLGDENRFNRQGTLDFIDNAVERSSGTIHARATVRNSDLSLTPGVFARVRLVTSAAAEVLLIPDSAVLPDQSDQIVLTVAPNGTVAPKLVKVGELRGGLRVIRSGIGPDDRVIVDGIPYATPGAKVKTQDGTIAFAAEQD